MQKISFVDAAMRSLSLLMLLVVAACSSGGGGSGTDEAVIDEIRVLPAAGSITVGNQGVLSAVAVFSDGSSRLITEEAQWTTSAPAVATVSNAEGTRGRVTAVAVGQATIRAQFAGITGSSSVTVTPATEVDRLEIAPATASIADGSPQAFTATLVFTNDTTQDVTTSVTWASGNTSIATISNAEGSKGVATGVAPGSVQISASLDGETATATLTVTDAEVTGLEISPLNASLASNRTLQYEATALYSDSTTQDVTDSAIWASSLESVATISETGLASGVDVGSTTISASFQGFSASTGLTVTAAVAVQSISVSPAAPSVPKGTQRQLTATATFADGGTEDITEEATWASADEAVATVGNLVDDKGLVSAVDLGTSSVSASFMSVSGATTVTVTDAVLESLDITPSSVTKPVSSSQQFTATGTYSDNSTADLTNTVVWTSSNNAIVSISNGAGSQGLAIANDVGTVTISAATQGFSDTASMTVTAATLQSIQVTPTARSLPNGFELQFTATGLYSDNSTDDITSSVSWASSDGTLASVGNNSGNKGLVTAAAMGDGTVSIQAASGDVLGSTNLDITASVLQSIEVTPDDIDLPVGSTQQYTATGTFNGAPGTMDLTGQVDWESSAPAKATIDPSTGLATAVEFIDNIALTISATDDDSGIVGDTPLTVVEAQVEAVTISPSSSSIANGRIRNFTAMGLFTDGQNRDITAEVTWASSNTTVATISNAAGTEGRATGEDVGSTVITATHPDGPSDDADLTVTDAALDSITVAPAMTSVAKGLEVNYTATGTYSDGTTDDITTEVVWFPSNATVATISNADGSEGVASTLATGSTSIQATLGSVQSPLASLTVTDATVASIEVTPLDPDIAKGLSQNFVATAVYTDGTEQIVTTNATWSSSDTVVADVSNAEGTKGRVVAKELGPADITANFGGVDGVSTVTVTAAVLNSIVVSPANEDLPVGFELQYTATGIFSDGSSSDETANVMWSTFDPAVASIDAAGRATGQAAGTTSVVATLNDVQGGTGVTVVDTALTAISIDSNDADNSLAIGESTQFSATGSFASGLSGFDLTDQVTWSSSNTDAVTIDQQGEASAGTIPGDSDITAERDGVTSNTVTMSYTGL